MWKKYFKLTELAPPRLLVRRGLVLNFRDENIDPAEILKLYEDGLPYFEMTAEGKEHYYGIKPEENSKPAEVSNKNRKRNSSKKKKNPVVEPEKVEKPDTEHTEDKTEENNTESHE